MDELNKQNAEDETTTAQPGSESAQPVPPADTGAQQTQQPTGESATAPETQLGKLVCPRCGNVFEPKEKKCPHCGMKNNLKLCKTCGATIAKNAKRCPKCGAKNKKPFYKRLGFWIIAAIVLIICWPSDKSNGTASGQDIIVGEWIAEMRLDIAANKVYTIDESENARLIFNSDHTGEVYLGDAGAACEWEFVAENGEVRQYRIMNSGESNGELKDLDYVNENSTEYAEFAGKLVLISDDVRVIYRRCDGTQQTKTTSASKNVSKSVESNTITQTAKPANSVQKAETSTANVSAGKKNALEQAYSYLNAMAFSYSGLIEQLEYEGYSTEEATYAVDNCGADWKEQAAKKAEEYLNSMSFSKSGLIEQLEYEGFTHEQAVYGADQAY